MKVHRWIAVLAALALSLGVAACGGGDDDDDGGGGGEVSEVPGFDGKTIKLGVLTPLTGPVAVIGNPLTAGNEVFIEAVNAEGGIAGKYPIELVQEDTQYLPNVAVQKYNQIKGDVVSFVQLLGTPINAGRAAAAQA